MVNFVDFQCHVADIDIASSVLSSADLPRRFKKTPGAPQGEGAVAPLPATSAFSSRALRRPRKPLENPGMGWREIARSTTH